MVVVVFVTVVMVVRRMMMSVCGHDCLLRCQVAATNFSPKGPALSLEIGS